MRSDPHHRVHTVTLTDFVTALEMELQLRGEPFDRADVLTFAEDVWPLAEDDPGPGRWADAFLVAMA
jgi:hypothetical protein